MKYKIFLKSLGIGAMLYVSTSSAFAVPVRIQYADYNIGKFTFTDCKTSEVVYEENPPFGSSEYYNVNLNPGEYLVECWDYYEGFYRGGLYVTVPEESDEYSDKNPYWLCFASSYCYVSNVNEDGTPFQKDIDYTLDFKVHEKRNDTDVNEQKYIMASWQNNGYDYYAFPILQAYVTYTLTPTDKHLDLIETTTNVVIYGTDTRPQKLTIAKGLPFNFTIPEEASLFLGEKDKHYMAFKEWNPYTVVSNDDNTKTYTFALSNKVYYYYYRISMPGAMTSAGKIEMSSSLDQLAFTESQLKEHGTPDYYNHDVTANAKLNFADILMNINKRNHLCLKQGDTKDLFATRVWQITDNTVGNYFVEPDYHFSVYNDKFEPANDVVTVDADGKLTAVGNGSAIVFVDYDACAANLYNTSGISNFEGGTVWSKLWAENKGLFVVTVGSGEVADSDSFKPNFLIDNYNDERKNSYKTELENLSLDAEHDVLYYLESENGYTYNYAPQGAVKVEVANPNVNLSDNTVSYAGFNEVSVNEDGTYSILLTFGRNVIRTTAADGAVAYQVISAKPMGYEVVNETREGDVVMPGDEISVKFHGLYHPMPKLAGIYNQSASIYFEQSNNDGPLYLGSGQYTFAGSDEAQTLNITLDSSYSEKDYKLSKGSIHVAGFGKTGGGHRSVNRNVGVGVNTSAAEISQYWGSIPDITIAVTGNSGVENITIDNAEVSGIYSIAGVSLGSSLDELPAGIYIVRYTNGKTAKVAK